MKKLFLHLEGKRQWAVMFFILGIALIPYSSHALTVSGTVNLPSPAAGTIEIDIYLEDTEGYSSTAQTLTFLASQNAKAYSLDTSVFTTGRLRYVCLSGCGDIFQVGYVTMTGTSYQWEDARTFDVATAPSFNVNFSLPLGYRVTGEVQLPSPDTAASDIGIEVTAQQTENYYSLTDYVIISAGGSSASYSILLPPDPSGLWIVYYTIPTRSPTQYYHTGYFVTPVSTTYVSTDAVKLFGSTLYTGRDLTLINGGTIEGSVSLPAGRVAPTGGVEIYLRAFNYEVYGGDDRVTVIIPEGGTTADYTLLFPWDQYRSWYVDYYCSGYTYNTCLDEGYLPEGHYSGPGEPTFFVRRQNYGALWAAKNHIGIDLQLIPAKQIGGKVNIPKPAPQGGLYLTVYADDPVYPGAMRDSVYIDAGAKSASYLVTIPEDSSLNWRVLHMFNEKIGYIQTAYYATGGTTHIKNDATLLNGGMDHYHIDMDAIPDQDNDGIPDSIDPIRNILNPAVFSLLLNSP